MDLANPSTWPIEQCRRFYAEEIRAVANVASPALVAAFARVEREKFLGPPPWQILNESFTPQSGHRSTSDPRDVYHNVLVALKSAQNLNNGQPSALAAWIGVLDLVAGNRVFHVGCGTGYYTAILAEVVGSSGSVIAAEVEPDLAKLATDALCPYTNVQVHSADGAAVEPGRCDGILINAGVTHPHRAWLETLNEDGRMVLPITVPMMPGLGRGVMVKITRRPNGFGAQIVSMVGIYSCVSVRDPALEAKLTTVLESREILKLKCVRLNEHEPDPTCLVHGAGICLSSSALE